MKITGKEFVKAIIAILQEKKQYAVSYDPKTYDTDLPKECLPWCVAFDAMIDTVSAPCLWPDGMNHCDHQDKENAKKKGYPDCISICVDLDGCVMYDFFDGTENEDFEHIFFDVYNELWDGGIEDEGADFWLEKFITRLRKHESNQTVDNYNKREEGDK